MYCSPTEANGGPCIASREGREGNAIGEAGGVAAPEELLRQLAAYLAARGIAAHVVGGAVRDRYLGRPTMDLDLAVGAGARELARDLARAWNGTAVELDLEHDTARVVLARRAGRPEIDLKSFAGDVHHDLLDRDFTINAMAVPLAQATRADWRSSIIDPTGGVADLQRRELRWVSPDAPRRDPLRLLRALRLAATLDLSIPPDTAALIRDLAPTLVRSAAERIRDEFFPLLGGKRAPACLEQCRSLGLLDALWHLAETSNEGGSQPDWRRGIQATRRVCAVFAGEGSWLSVRHWSALKKWLEGQECASRRRQDLLLWVALLEGAFPNSSIQVSLSEALRLSRKELAVVGKVAKGCDQLGLLSGAPAPPNSRCLDFFRETRHAAPFCLLLAAAHAPEPQRRRLGGLLGSYFDQSPVARPDPLVTGSELAQTFPNVAAEQFGRLLRALADAHAEGEIRSPSEALRYAGQLVSAEEEGSAHAG